MILGNMNVLDTSQMNVHSAGKVNTLSLLYVLSHMSCIFGLIPLWEDIHLKVANHLGTSLTFLALVPCNVAMLSTLILNNIVILAKS